MIYQEKDEVVYRDPDTGNETRATVIGKSEGFPEYYILKVKQVNGPLFRYLTVQPKDILRKFKIMEDK